MEEIENEEKLEEVEEMKVVSWNVLAKAFADKSIKKGDANPKIFEWERRVHKIATIVPSFKADIICLQEVDQIEDHKKYLEANEYSFIYEKNKRKRDGVLVAWKTEKYSLVANKRVEFDEIATLHVELNRKKILCANLGMMVLLQTAGKTGRKFVVATAHLQWKPIKTDTKILQAMHMVKSVHAFLEEKEEGKDLPIILAGDFNSLPNSAVVSLLSSGKVDNSHNEFREYISKDYQNFLKFLNGENSKGGHLFLSLPFTFQSAYPFQIGEGNDKLTPLSKNYVNATNFVSIFAARIDYIWHTAHFKVKERRNVLNEEMMEKLCEWDQDFTTKKKPSVSPLILPDQSWPSDHLALVCTFQLLK